MRSYEITVPVTFTIEAVTPEAAKVLALEILGDTDISHTVSPGECVALGWPEAEELTAADVGEAESEDDDHAAI